MNNIISALNYLNYADLDHAAWIAVGMALKTEGYDVDVWDEWSARDPARYHPGECERRWRSFRGNDDPVTGASIIKMAQDRGWMPFSGADGIMCGTRRIFFVAEDADACMLGAPAKRRPPARPAVT